MQVYTCLENQRTNQSSNELPTQQPSQRSSHPPIRLQLELSTTDSHSDWSGLQSNSEYCRYWYSYPTTFPGLAATANVSNDQLKPCQSHSGSLSSTSKLKSKQSKLLKWYWNSQLQTQSNQVEYCHYWCGHAATFQGHSATAELNYD